MVSTSPSALFSASPVGSRRCRLASWQRVSVGPNAVLGLSYLLARTPLDREQQGMLTRLQVAGKALLAVINDILDMSKIEAGKMNIEKEIVLV